MKETHVIAKVLLVSPAGEVLTLRRSNTDQRRPGEGDLPGGWVDPGEDFTAAAIRETEEEAGIKLDFNDLKLVYANTEPFEGKIVCRLFFIAKTDQTKVTLSYEHDHAAWLTLDKAIEAIPYKVQNDFLVYVEENGLL